MNDSTTRFSIPGVVIAIISLPWILKQMTAIRKYHIEEKTPELGQGLNVSLKNKNAVTGVKSERN